MTKTIEYSGDNHRVSPATIELLIGERNKGKSLRQVGQMFGRSYEAIRQILAKYDLPQEAFLPEAKVAAKLGYPVNWLAQLRKEGITGPVKRWVKHRYCWLYSEEQVSQIPSLIAERRKREPTAYCFKCRQKREMKDAKAITMKNERLATQGICPKCGTKMFRIGKT